MPWLFAAAFLNMNVLCESLPIRQEVILLIDRKMKIGERTVNKIIIREERKEDYMATELMTMRAFWNVHGPGCNEHLLVHKLRASEDYLPVISRVAELDGKIIGAIFYTKSRVIDGDIMHEVISFGPLAVEPMCQSLGVGGMLLKETIKLAKEAGYKGICILGEPEYYPKHGFVTCDKYKISDSNGYNYDALMAYELQEDGFSGIKRRLKESEVFEQCEDKTEIEEFTSQFPYYERLELKCQWLHKEKLGRISSVQKNQYTIQFWESQLSAKLKGKFYDGKKQFPVVRDYVTFDYNTKGESIILEVCERKSILKRPFPKDHAVRKVEKQEMVANADYVFIVTSANDDFNVNRIVRYMAVANEGGVKPVVILTKADLTDNVSSYTELVKEAVNDVDICVLSVVKGVGLEQLEKYMKPSNTIALIGSSGVGKSTLVNALIGKEVMDTKAIRESDSKGRHTTTYRQMFVLESGVTIIDTPGMREIDISDATRGLEETFDDITELSMNCKFGNCKHKAEPGCAVKKAVEEGILTEKRLKLYHRLKKDCE